MGLLRTLPAGDDGSVFSLTTSSLSKAPSPVSMRGRGADVAGGAGSGSRGVKRSTDGRAGGRPDDSEETLEALDGRDVCGAAAAAGSCNESEEPFPSRSRVEKTLS